MKVLVDTHAFLWWAFDAPELSPSARGVLADRGNEVLVSSASAWEIATKFRLGRLPEASVLVQDLDRWISVAGFKSLPITVLHSQRAGLLPQPHRDPFDRMIAAQALVENISVISRDEALRKFGVTLLW